MSKELERFGRQNRELREELRRRIGSFLGGSDEGLTALRDFLFDELLTHARGEERHLYPVVGPLLCQEGTAMETMTMDHVAIERHIDRYAGLLADHPQDRVAIERTLVALEAIVQLHMDKEEAILLPALGRHPGLDPGRVLRGIQESPVRD